MKLFWKYLFPPIFGLLNYFTIRLLLDAVTGMKFWHRALLQNTIEIGACVVIGYFFVWTQRVLYRYFDKQWGAEMSYSRVLKEVSVVCIFCLLYENMFLTPIAAFTDDGLQGYDVADINVIPTLYAIMYYGISRSHTFLQAYVSNKVKLEKVMNDQLQAELKFLKSQLHPHFIFNALNTIYFQMDEDVSAAKKSVELFSELLRYQLYDQQQTVSIKHELRYLQSFINLQQVRASEKLQLNVYFDPQLEEQQIYPLLFFPLVENAFKYVGGEYQLHIKAWQENDRILFSIENNIPTVMNMYRAGGIGLENLRRRLELLYPEKHSFEINRTDSTFSVLLSVALLPAYQHTLAAS
jgi:two-component system, LytTR family, sensor kinase